jgi:hypothetical protein
MMVPDEFLYFMYRLFKDDDCSSGYIALHDRVSNVDELEEMEGDARGLI